MKLLFHIPLHHFDIKGRYLPAEPASSDAPGFDEYFELESVKLNGAEMIGYLSDEAIDALVSFKLGLIRRDREESEHER